MTILDLAEGPTGGGFIAKVYIGWIPGLTFEYVFPSMLIDHDLSGDFGRTVTEKLYQPLDGFAWDQTKKCNAWFDK